MLALSGRAEGTVGADTVHATESAGACGCGCCPAMPRIAVDGLWVGREGWRAALVAVAGSLAILSSADGQRREGAAVVVTRGLAERRLAGLLLCAYGARLGVWVVLAWRILPALQRDAAAIGLLGIARLLLLVAALDSQLPDEIGKGFPLHRPICAVAVSLGCFPERHVGEEVRTYQPVWLRLLQ